MARKKKKCSTCGKVKMDKGQALKLAVIQGMDFESAVLYADLQMFTLASSYNLFLSLLTPEEKLTAIDKVHWK